MNIDAKVLEALALPERGDWQQAHAIVQQHETQDAAWLHGIVHVLEGDLEMRATGTSARSARFRWTRSPSSRPHGKLSMPDKKRLPRVCP